MTENARSIFIVGSTAPLIMSVAQVLNLATGSMEMFVKYVEISETGRNDNMCCGWS